MVWCVPPQCSVVLFDIDDTLMDHRGAAQRAATWWLRRYPSYRDHTDQDLIGLWMEQEHRHYKRFECGEISHNEQRCERMRALVPGGQDLPETELLGHFATFFDQYVNNWSPLPGAVEAIQWLETAGLRVGYLTNGALGQQLNKVQALGLGRRRPLFAVSHLAAGKPDRRAFEAACAGMGARPGEVLMVGDNPLSDYEAAQAAGLHAVVVHHEHHTTFADGSAPDVALQSARRHGHYLADLTQLQAPH